MVNDETETQSQNIHAYYFSRQEGEGWVGPVGRLYQPPHETGKEPPPLLKNMQTYPRRGKALEEELPGTVEPLPVPLSSEREGDILSSDG